MSSGEVIAIDPMAPDQQIIDRVTDLILNNGVVVAPTETRYGLLTRADQPENVKRVYKIKQRNLNLPTAVLIKSVGDLDEHIRVNDLARTLAQKFLPGPLTLVGKSVSALKAPVVIDGRIGLRVSSSPLVAALTESVGIALTATSANLSGQPEPVLCIDILDSFGNAVDLYLDAGRLHGPVSTVVDISVRPPKLLREGAISSDEIISVIGDVQ